jgi:hypothetical protein
VNDPKLASTERAACQANTGHALDSRCSRRVPWARSTCYQLRMSAPKALPWLLLISACGTSAPATPPPPSLVALSSVPSGARAFEGAPPWAGEVEPLPLRGDNEPSTVPQLRDMADALALIGTAPATETRGVLVCEIVVARVRAYDEAAFVGLGAPDVSVYVRIDGGPEARARIGEDAFSGKVSVPNVTLPRGARVALRLRDRDVGGDEPMGEGEGTWTGRLALRTEIFTATCGLLPYAKAAERGAPALGEATRSLEVLSRAPRPLDVVHDPLAVFTETEAVRASLREAGSYLGYVHPDVARGLAALGRFERARLVAYRASLERAYAAASPAGTETRVSENARVSVPGFTCPSPPELGLGPRCRFEMVTTGSVPARDLPLAARVIALHEVSAPCLRDTSEPSGTWVTCKIETLPRPDARVLLQISEAGATVLARAR